ncbi:MAG TPA: transposase [Thermoleophilaceae bacterium]
MARKNRVQFAGGVFHVWVRRVERWPLFKDEDDYRRYLAILAETVQCFDWVLLSFCLMPNHVHLLVELRDANLPNGMHSLHQRYVTYFNHKYARNGRLFEHRYESKPVQDDLYFVTVVQYIERNPVDARLCNTPEGWPWSSRGVVAAGGCPSWLADDVLDARRRELKDGACPCL